MNEEVKDSTAERLLHSTRDVHRECMEVVAEIESCLDRGPASDGQWVSCLRRKLWTSGS